MRSAPGGRIGRRLSLHIANPHAFISASRGVSDDATIAAVYPIHTLPMCKPISIGKMVLVLRSLARIAVSLFLLRLIRPCRSKHVGSSLERANVARVYCLRRFRGAREGASMAF
jgi:hypothetical protein